MKLNKLSIFLAMLVCGIAVLTMATGGEPRNVSTRNGGQHLEGSWTFKVEAQGLPFGFPLGYTSLITFEEGGGAVQTAWIPPGSFAPSTIAGVNPWTGHGEWVRTGNRQFAITVLIPRFDNTGTFLGLAKSRASIQLDQTEREASGRFNGDILDPSGNVILTGFGGTVKATRLQVELLP